MLMLDLSDSTEYLPYLQHAAVNKRMCLTDQILPVISGNWFIQFAFILPIKTTILIGAKL